ncbi:hypothetical protein AB0E59_13220 [Lentzea sp. NPDC034063]|uniref:hypothetical protein n=1 Tax=unclassified Lentzea TaxID=2643253 RepID=UPI0034041B8E
MIGWYSYYFADEDVWFHYEVDDEGWVRRQVDLHGADLRPTTAAALAEVLHARDTGGLEAVIAYEKRFGVLAEGAVHDELRAAPGVEEISAGEFERLWAAAREHLERAT